MGRHLNEQRHGEKALSICWITFNDEAELAKSLTSLRKSVFESSLDGLHQIEVLISDNCSMDNTEAIVKMAISDLPIDVTPFRQLENLGFRGNLEFCAGEASSEWVLFLGAGDIVDLEAAAEFIKLGPERFSECNVVYFNSNSRDERTGILEVQSYSADDRPSFSQAPIPIFRVSTLRRIIATESRLSGDFWPQVEWALSASSEAVSQVGTFPYSLITSSRPKSGWWSKPDAFLIPLALLPVIDNALSSPRWDDRALSAKHSFSISTPASWVYQSRAVHGSVRASVAEVLMFWRYCKFSLRSGLAFTLLVIVNSLPIELLRLVGSITRRYRLRVSEALI